MKRIADRFLQKIYPPFFTLMTMAMMVSLHFSFPIMELYAASWRWCGLLPLLTGLILCICATCQLAAQDTTLNPSDLPQKLVTDGCFRQTRNPIYLGFVMAAAGVWLLCGTLSPAAALVVCILAADRYYIPFEEGVMLRTFGQAYEDYRNRVRRWL